MLIKWINNLFSEEKTKSLNTYVTSKLDILISQANENILENCLRLKRLLQEDTFFGINVLYFDNSLNQYSSHIQILEFREYNGGQLIYCKGGVNSYNEVPIKISDYRHLIEWNPLDKTVKLIDLGIKQGQEYAKSTQVMVVFTLNYSVERPCLKYINPKEKPNTKTINKWIEYVSYIVDDPKILDDITGIIRGK